MLFSFIFTLLLGSSVAADELFALSVGEWHGNIKGPSIVGATGLSFYAGYKSSAACPPPEYAQPCDGFSNDTVIRCEATDGTSTHCNLAVQDHPSIQKIYIERLSGLLKYIPKRDEQLPLPVGYYENFSIDQLVGGSAVFNVKIEEDKGYQGFRACFIYPGRWVIQAKPAAEEWDGYHCGNPQDIIITAAGTGKSAFDYP